MKLSFSTKGWHDASWEDFLTAAQDLGFEGIEIHNLTRFGICDSIEEILNVMINFVQFPHFRFPFFSN